MTNTNISQDPNLDSQILLQSILFHLDPSATTAPPVPIATQWTGPSRTAIWSQSLLYVSLTCSLFAALSAVLGKQWLSYFSSVGERGDTAARGMDRHRKYIALELWHLHVLMTAIPVLLQFSLLVFALGLCAYVLEQQRVVGIVIILANGIGLLYYLVFVGLYTLYKDAPFQTSLSDMTAQLSRSCIAALKAFTLTMCRVLADIARHTGSAFMAVYVPQMSEGSQPNHEEAERGVRLTLRTAGTSDVVSEQDGHSKHVGEREEDSLRVLLSAVCWLFITSSAPQDWESAWAVIPTVRWSPCAIRELSFDVLDRLLGDIRSCLEAGSFVQAMVPIDRQRNTALLAISAFLHLAWEKIADSCEETNNWLRESHAHGSVRIFTQPHLPRPQSHELLRLSLALEETAKCLDNGHDMQSRYRLRSVIPIIPPSYTGTDTVYARAMFYLAQQVTPNFLHVQLEESGLRESRRRILHILAAHVSGTDSVISLAVQSLACIATVHAGIPRRLQLVRIETCVFSLLVCLTQPLLMQIIQGSSRSSIARCPRCSRGLAGHPPAPVLLWQQAASQAHLAFNKLATCSGSAA